MTDTNQQRASEHLKHLDDRLGEIAKRIERTDETPSTEAERSAIADELHDIKDELRICYGDPKACEPTTTLTT